MTGRVCKAAIDCNGEILEATQNVPLLIVNDFLTDEAIDDYNKMKESWAKDYSRWKARHIDFDDD